MKARILPFESPHACGRATVGKVRPDGSIVFQGETYRTIRDVPEECRALRPDVETYRQWVRLYRAIDPRNRHR